MSITFNADEVFEMAEQIERNGAKFYREAAAKTSDRPVKDMFLRLAAHGRRPPADVSADEKDAQPSRRRTKRHSIPRMRPSFYLQAMADNRGFEGMKSPHREADRPGVHAGAARYRHRRREELHPLLRRPRRISSPTEAGRDKVEVIIREEAGHLAELRRQLAATESLVEGNKNEVPMPPVQLRLRSRRGRSGQWRRARHRVRRICRTTGCARNAAPAKRSSSRWR